MPSPFATLKTGSCVSRPSIASVALGTSTSYTATTASTVPASRYRRSVPSSSSAVHPAVPLVRDELVPARAPRRRRGDGARACANADGRCVPSSRPRSCPPDGYQLAPPEGIAPTRGPSGLRAKDAEARHEPGRSCRTCEPARAENEVSRDFRVGRRTRPPGTRPRSTVDTRVSTPSRAIGNPRARPSLTCARVSVPAASVTKRVSRALSLERSRPRADERFRRTFARAHRVTPRISGRAAMAALVRVAASFAWCARFCSAPCAARAGAGSRGAPRARRCPARVRARRRGDA